MNYGISVLFRLIPLVMGVICLCLGLLVLRDSTNPGGYTAGHVLISLTAICYALFTTASVIILQLLGNFNRSWLFLLPFSGYALAALTMGWGLSITSIPRPADAFVSGHVVFGVGMIAACVATVAAASVRFTLIPKNSAGTHASGVPAAAYSRGAALILMAVPLVCTLIGAIWGGSLLADQDTMENVVAGHVLIGIAMVCASLIALVATVARQTRNLFDEKERWYWTAWVLVMGTAALLLGIYVLSTGTQGYRLAPGIVLVGLGMICYSIVSKVLLLALVWRRESKLANRVPLIPVLTCLACLFCAAFLAEANVTDPNYFIASRILTGLGAVCFTLFSIVSILEAGTSKKSA
ncbi:DUF2776 domain-containing protein [Bordetella avium]|uniref:DUF2776 domain-containing protein n=1 Tax=Bordetella avium TaxID=521 RepID=UPI000E0A3A59|nr:DUF2776 domain-containing protein [Bordetella avium]RIQ12842.1 DUF2776 family protein [Bordetella avium]RIQ19123.1 DUF2776 family protein [Bordetella avium]RIQ32034.1 DUF2776 family protein [Bordetella avium]RIQ53409.1 DUF2776 family protein [Bordetella avium]RIQ61724.1 DUF2776 family protein [Bordetella avium]